MYSVQLNKSLWNSSVSRPLKELQPAPAWPRAATWSCITGAPIPMRPMEQSRKGGLQSHGS